MQSLLEKTREINKVIHNNIGHYINFTEISKSLSKTINANIYIISKKGKIIDYVLFNNSYCQAMLSTIKLNSYVHVEDAKKLLGVIGIVANINNESNCVFKKDKACIMNKKYSTYIPIFSSDRRLGTIILTKSSKFSKNDLFLAEYSATLINFELLYSIVEKTNNMERQKSIVDIALKKLSLTELKAVKFILNELGYNDGLLVTSEIAYKYSITRSIITNALRKLECAGIIKVSSLGMKGTSIKVLNNYIRERYFKEKFLCPQDKHEDTDALLKYTIKRTIDRGIMAGKPLKQ